MTIQPNFKLEKWLKEFTRIESDIVRLKFNNDEFHNIAHRFNSRKLDVFYWEFAKRNYVSYMTMAVRRIAGTYRDGISLSKLLIDLRDNASTVTRKWFLIQWPGAIGESTFEDFFGKDKSLIADVVSRNITELADFTKPIRDRADQYEAHIDLNPKRDTDPTFNDLDQSIGIIVKLYKKYYYLFKQSSISI